MAHAEVDHVAQGGAGSKTAREIVAVSRALEEQTEQRETGGLGGSPVAVSPRSTFGCVYTPHMSIHNLTKSVVACRLGAHSESYTSIAWRDEACE